MPVDTPIAMLNIAQQQSQDAFGRIDHAMSQAMQSNLQAGEFAAEMTAKAAQFAEQKRMNDVQAENIRTDNFLKFKEYELNKQLAPLRLQTAQLQLQATKYRFQKDMEGEHNKQFDDITSIYDDQVGFDILHTGSTDMAKDYYAFKGDWKARVANGQQFDPTAYQKGINGIRGKYQGQVADPKAPYSPETQFMMTNISPRLGQTYEKNHPVVQQNRNALGSSYYDMTDSQVGEFANKFGSLYSPEEYGGLGSGRTVYQTNKLRFKEYLDEADKLDSKLALVDVNDNPVQYAQIKQQASEYRNQAKKAFDTNVKLQTDAANGKFGVHPEDVIPPIQAQPTVVKPSEHTVPDVTMGIKSKTNEADVAGKKLKFGIDKTFTALGGTEKNPEIPELKGANDFSWFDLKGSGDKPDDASLNSIKNTIESNIESLGDIGERFNHEKAAKLFSAIDKDVEVPLSSFAMDVFQKAGLNAKGGALATRSQTTSDISSTAIDYLYNRNRDENHITFGKLDDKKHFMDKFNNNAIGGTINNANELFGMISKIKNPSEREAVQKEIYAALITASLSSAVTTN